METPAEISHLPALHSRLASVGLTLEAREWLIKALHPVATVPDRAVPDRSTAVVALPTYRESYVVGPPVGVTGFWDSIMIQAGGDCNLVYWAAGPAGTDFSSPTAPAFPASGMIGVQQSRWLTPCFGRLISTMASSQFGVQQLMPAPWRTRARCMSMTTYLTASALNNQGTVYAAQVPSRPIPTGFVTYPSTLTDPAGFSLAAARYRFSLPMDENTMQLVDPKCYVAPATEGAYCVSRYLGDTYPFSDPSIPGTTPFWDYGTGQVGFPNYPGGILQTDLSNQQLPVIPDFTTTYQDAHGGYRHSWVSEQCISTTGGRVQSVAPPLDSCFTNMTTSVVLWRGLSNQATVTVRAVGGFEVVVLPDSPSRTFVGPPAPYNSQALSLYHEYADVMRSAYPASYNSLGGMIKWMVGAAARVLPTVARYVPVVGDVIRAIQGRGSSSSESGAPASLSSQQVVTRTSTPRRSMSAGSSRVSSRAGSRVRVALPGKAPTRKKKIKGR